MTCRVINQTAGEIRIQANRLLAMLTNIVEHAEATAAAADLTDDDAQRADIWMDLKKIRGALTRAELAIKRSAKASGLNIQA